MKVAVLGDVGQPVYHVGDEAMTHAAIAQLAARGLDHLVVLTRDVEHSRAAFGVEAAPTLTFPWPPRERSDYLRQVRAAVRGDSGALPSSDQAWRVIDQLRGCDALLVAGGGNMNSLYGWLLYERAATVDIARTLGMPIVVSGQTLGPQLFGADREVARDLLSGARLVGARESASLHLVQDLMKSVAPGPSIRACLDDAFFHPVPVTAEPERFAPQEPFIAATFAPGHGETDREDYLSAVARALDDVSAATGLPVVFLPHMATPHHEHGDVDEHMHRDIAARMSGGDAVLLPIQDAHRTIDLTRRSSLVLTSRYHPVVFGLDAGVPVVAVSPDAYSDVRMRGALRHWGLKDLALTLPEVFDGTFVDVALDVWRHRTVLSSHLAEYRPHQQSRHDRWWDDVARVLRGGEAEEAVGLPEIAAPSFGADWRVRSAASARTFVPTSSTVADLRVEIEHLRGETDALRRERDDARSELASWMDSRSMKLARRIGSVASLVRRGR